MIVAKYRALTQILGVDGYSGNGWGLSRNCITLANEGDVISVEYASELLDLEELKLSKHSYANDDFLDPEGFKINWPATTEFKTDVFPESLIGRLMLLGSIETVPMEQA